MAMFYATFELGHVGLADAQVAAAGMDVSASFFMPSTRLAPFCATVSL